MNMQSLEGRARPAPQNGDLARRNALNYKLGFRWRYGYVEYTWQGQDLFRLLVKGDIFLLVIHCNLMGVRVYQDFQLGDSS